MINAFYNQALSSSGYPAPTSWSFTGSLPPGLSLNTTTGIISGTPSPLARGTYTITVTASDGGGSADTQTITMTVGAPTPSFNEIIYDFGTWTGTGTATAYINLDASGFQALVFANTRAVVPPSYYSIVSGSTFITFTETYLKTLSNGTYYFIAEYDTYDTHLIQLVINNRNSTAVSGNTDGSNSPSTGDDPYMLMLTTTLAIVSALCLFMLLLYYRLAYSKPKTRKIF